MKKIFKSVAFCLIASMAMIMSSCSSDDSKILSSIPDDVLCVVAFNGERMLNELDVKMEDGTLSMPSEFKKAFSSGDKKEFKKVAEALEGVNTECMYIVFYLNEDERQRQYVTFTLKDEEKFVDYITDELDYEKDKEIDPFDAVYGTRWNTILIRDNQVWIVENEWNYNSDYEDSADTAKRMRKHLNKADEGSMADVDGIGDKLGDNSQIVRLAVNPNRALKYATGESVKKLKGAWAYGTATVDDNAVVAEMALVKEGEPMEVFEGFQDVNTSAISYIPSDYNYGFACSMSKDFKWDTIIEGISSMDRDAASMMDVLKPYLKGIDGTILVAGKIPDENQINAMNYSGDISELGFLMMVHMKQNRVDDAVSNLVELAQQSGLTVSSNGKGVYSLGMPTGGAIYLGNVDGYLAVSTKNPKKQSNDFTQMFEGKKAAAFVKTKKLSKYSSEFRYFKYGVDFTMEFDGSTVKGVLKLTDNDEPIILTVAKSFVKTLNAGHNDYDY